MPHLSKILVYPIKSLEGVELQQAHLLPGGAIAHDREFALFDAQGEVVNAKRTATLQTIRSTYDLSERTVTLSLTNQPTSQTFHLDGDRPALEAWFSEALGFSVELRQNLQMGFPDDTNASGPTVVSAATLETVASWFSPMSLAEVRQRFRANLEIAEAPAFWEDGLFSGSGQPAPFQVGTVTLLSNNLCQRCIVPTRHPLTGDRHSNFQKVFSQKRQETLPDWALPSQFNHFYKLTLNTKVPASEAGKLLQIGDVVQ